MCRLPPWNVKAWKMAEDCWESAIQTNPLLPLPTPWKQEPRVTLHRQRAPHLGQSQTTLQLCRQGRSTLADPEPKSAHVKSQLEIPSQAELSSESSDMRPPGPQTSHLARGACSEPGHSPWPPSKYPNPLHPVPLSAASFDSCPGICFETKARFYLQMKSYWG